jgi:hypothetical protein
MALAEEKEMSEKEEIRDLFLRYGIEMPRRFRRNEKDAFCNAAGKEFQKNGYPVKAIAGTYKVRAVDVAANDLKKARISSLPTMTHRCTTSAIHLPIIH